MPTSLRVLIVEDMPDDAELMVLHLKNEGFAPDWQRVETEADFHAALHDPPEIILTDWRLPAFSGLRALAIHQERRIDCPFIVVSGSIGEEAAVDVLRDGAADYVLKDRMARLGPAVKRALEDRRVRLLQQSATAVIELQAAALQAAANGIMLTDREGTVEWVNEAFISLTGYTAQEAIGRNPRDLVCSGVQSADFYARFWATILSGDVWRGEMINRRKDGTLYTEEQTVTAVRDAQGGVKHFIAIKQDVTARGLAEMALRASEERLREMFDLAITGIFQASVAGKALAANPAFVRMLGYASEEELLNTLTDLPRGLWVHPDERTTIARRMEAEGFVRGHECEFLKKDGSRFWVSLNAAAAHGDASGEKFFQASVEDITERRLAEASREALQVQLLQSQKMESIGLLAGGIAHDFNNMLAAITGNAELAIRTAGAEHPAQRHLQAIQEAAERAAKLTGKLLVFARKLPPSTTVLNLNPVIDGILTMLNPLLGEQVHVEWTPGAGLWAIAADATQIEQVLTNLAINARDAKVDGDVTLSISTANVELDAAPAASHALAGTPAGALVRLRVQDNGAGMDALTVSKIYDPFFTTKAPGKGTGLGLSTVFGIVQQHGGFIDVESTPGVGTTFSLYFPRSTQSAEEDTDPVKSVPRGTETILVAEDEEGVRASTTEMLRMLGYVVHAARDGVEATMIFAGHAREIHLLLTDVIMPGMNGAQLKADLLRERPDLKVLFMSGYASDIVGIKGVLEPGVHFVRKPFSLTGLANAVRRALDT